MVGRASILGNVFPISHQHNGTNSSTVDCELFSERLFCEFACSKKPSDFYYLFLRQLGLRIVLTAHKYFLRYAVHHVVFVGPKPEVVRVDTSPIVRQWPAIVTDRFSFRDWAFVQLVRKSMSGNRIALSAVIFMKLAIASLVNSRSPKPAVIGFLHVIPEILFDWHRPFWV